jgi:hypothetical protein
MGGLGFNVDAQMLTGPLTRTGKQQHVNIFGIGMVCDCKYDGTRRRRRPAPIPTA